MTTFAKIFVVVNLVFALAVFGAAAALLGAQDNYKEQFETYKVNFETFQAKASADKKNLEDRLAGQRQNASDSEAARKEAVSLASERLATLEEARKLAAALASANEKFSEQLNTLAATATKRQAQLEKLSGDAAKADQQYMDAKNQLQTRIAEVQRLADELAKTMGERDAVITDGQNLVARVRDLEFVVTAYRTKYGALSPTDPNVPEGLVLQVKGSLVLISLGSNDGVRIGDDLHLSRGESYVGTIRITKVEKDAAVGRTTDVKGSGFPPAANDRVYAR